MSGETEPAALEMGYVVHDGNARRHLDDHDGHRSVPDGEATMFLSIARGLRDIGAQLEAGLEGTFMAYAQRAP